MKKITIATAFVCLISIFSASAQKYEVGTNVVSAGVGLGSSIAGYTYGTQSPGWNLQYERGLAEAGPGVISGGLYVGFKTYKYDDPEGAYDFKWNYTIVGLRAAWHYTGLNIEKLDLYGGLMLSYNHLSVSYNSPQDIQESGDYNSDIFLTPFVGARYYFIPQLAVFGELGYGVSTLNLGLALKF